MSGLSELSQYVALLASAPPVKLAAELHAALSCVETEPVRLHIYVPEICDRLAREVAVRNFSALAQLAKALSEALDFIGIEERRREWLSQVKDPAARAEVAYLLGRLQSMLVVARQIPLLDIPAAVEAEGLDGGIHQAILECLAREGGSMSLRALRLALEGEGATPKTEQVRRGLIRLVRVALVVAETGRERGLTYRISELGRRLLDSPPAWLTLVERSYRAFLNDAPAVEQPHAHSLRSLFIRVASQSEEGP